MILKLNCSQVLVNKANQRKRGEGKRIRGRGEERGILTQFVWDEVTESAFFQVPGDIEIWDMSS